MRRTIVDVESLTRELYGAVLDDGSFATSVARLGVHFRSHVNALHVQDYAVTRSELELTGALNSEDLGAMLADYSARWSGKNLWVERSHAGLEAKGWSEGDEVVTERELLASEYHEHFLKPLDIRYGAGISVFQSGDAMSIASFNRSRAAGPFSTLERRLFGELRPHLSNAYRIHRRVATLLTENRTLRASFDMTPVALVLLDYDGYVHAINSSASRLVEAGVFRISIGARGNTLVLPHLSEREAYSAALRALRAAPTGVEPHHVLLAPEPARIERGSVLQLLNLPGPRIAWHPYARVIAIVLPLARGGVPSQAGEILRIALRATRAEARFVVALWERREIDSTAKALGIAPSTARSHLKSLYAKTGVHDQAELIRIVDRLVRH